MCAAAQAAEDAEREGAMANIRALSIWSLLLSALALPNVLAAEYTLMPSPLTVHVGHFSAALKPVLTINSGDIVIIETVSGPDPEEVDASGVVPPSAVPEYVRAQFIARRSRQHQGLLRSHLQALSLKE
jgi:hypothetical protein